MSASTHWLASIQQHHDLLIRLAAEAINQSAIATPDHASALGHLHLIHSGSMSGATDFALSLVASEGLGESPSADTCQMVVNTHAEYLNRISTKLMDRLAALTEPHLPDD